MIGFLNVCMIYIKIDNNHSELYKERNCSLYNSDNRMLHAFAHCKAYQANCLVLYRARTTVSQDVQTWFSVQLAFAKFLSKIRGNF